MANLILSDRYATPISNHHSSILLHHIPPSPSQDMHQSMHNTRSLIPQAPIHSLTASAPHQTSSPSIESKSRQKKRDKKKQTKNAACNVIVVDP
jgi:hypothetical protein